MTAQSKFTIPKGKIEEIPGLTYRSPHTFEFKRRVQLVLLPPVLAALVRSIMATQLTRPARLARADDVIDNSGSPSAIVPQVVELDRKYRALAANLVRNPARGA